MNQPRVPKTRAVAKGEAVPWVRQVTGLPYQYTAYVVRDNRVVTACSHKHSRRKDKNGDYFAHRCAARMARKMNRESA